MEKRRTKEWYCWVIVAACLLLSAASIGMLSYFNALFVTPVCESLHIARSSLSLMSTFSTVTTMLSALFGWSALPKLTLPIGISFYTFQILSYVIDLYRGEIRVQRNYFYLLLYVSFFPQLIAGPIVRYETVEQEIQERHESIDDVAAGLRRFILGLAKKVILANNIARIAETIYAGDSAVYGTTLYWLAAVAYALQIYFDFSGYSDMAIGLGRMFGFHFLENFDHPYTALSITDFWRRWHISLSTWFRDYVYIPLGGNRVKKSRWIRHYHRLRHDRYLCRAVRKGARAEIPRHGKDALRRRSGKRMVLPICP